MDHLRFWWNRICFRERFASLICISYHKCLKKSCSLNVGYISGSQSFFLIENLKKTLRISRISTEILQKMDGNLSPKRAKICISQRFPMHSKSFLRYSADSRDTFRYLQHGIWMHIERGKSLLANDRFHVRSGYFEG